MFNLTSSLKFILCRDNFKYFDSSEYFTLFGYLTFCKKNNILRDKQTEHKKYEEYLAHIADNVPTKKKQALEAKNVSTQKCSSCLYKYSI